MAEIIEPFKSRKGRPPVYPWETWADGQARRLYRGTEDECAAGEKDFHAQLLSFRTMVHRKARDLNMTAQTKINEADGSIQLRFTPKF